MDRACRGDVIYVERRLSIPETSLVQDITEHSLASFNLISFRHYGIYIGDDDVVHFVGDSDTILGNICIGEQT